MLPNEVHQDLGRVLFIGYGLTDPSSRYRAEHIVEYANKHYPQCNWDFFGIQQPGGSRTKMLLRKIKSLWVARDYRVIVLQRNPVSLLSPFYELFLKFVLRKKLVFDFDDALWIITGKSAWAIKYVIQIADAVIVGNTVLARYAQKYNKNVFIINTLIDTDRYRLERAAPEEGARRLPIRVIWTGSRPSNQYLEKLEEVLVRIKSVQGEKIEFIFLSDTEPGFRKLTQYTFRKWDEDTEKNLLSTSDIGIMPLSDSEIARCKCGFKLILYGAYELACIASPIGINSQIIEDGKTGFLADSMSEWYETLTKYIESPEELKNAKARARRRICEQYSLAAKFGQIKRVIET